MANVSDASMSRRRALLLVTCALGLGASSGCDNRGDVIVPEPITGRKNKFEREREEEEKNAALSKSKKAKPKR